MGKDISILQIVSYGDKENIKEDECIVNDSIMYPFTSTQLCEKVESVLSKSNRIQGTTTEEDNVNDFNLTSGQSETKIH